MAAAAGRWLLVLRVTGPDDPCGSLGQLGARGRAPRARHRGDRAGAPSLQLTFAQPPPAACNRRLRWLQLRVAPLQWDWQSLGYTTSATTLGMIHPLQESTHIAGPLFKIRTALTVGHTGSGPQHRSGTGLRYFDPHYFGRNSTEKVYGKREGRQKSLKKKKISGSPRHRSNWNSAVFWLCKLRNEMGTFMECPTRSPS